MAFIHELMHMSLTTYRKYVQEIKTEILTIPPSELEGRPRHSVNKDDT